jgi:glycosyltransferase involved in cell wall biosynthesis
MTSASIVSQVFNRANLVHRALDSALTQTHPCEVLLVDHGSTDEIASVVRQYGDRIRYVRREIDQGPIVCWRDGIEHATGEIVHITYDDDWISPTFMERCLALLRDDVGLVYTGVVLHQTEDGCEVPLFSHPCGVRPVAGLVHYLLRNRLTISPGCAVFRRRDALANLLSEVPGATGPYGKNSGVGEDLLLFLLATLSYPRYAHEPARLAHFLAHAGSITIDAVSSGKGREIEAAYARAKDYYLRQPGALQPLKGTASLIERCRWAASSRTLMHQVWKRLRWRRRR